MPDGLSSEQAEVLALYAKAYDGYKMADEHKQRMIKPLVGSVSRATATVLPLLRKSAESILAKVNQT